MRTEVMAATYRMRPLLHVVGDRCTHRPLVSASLLYSYSGLVPIQGHGDALKLRRFGRLPLVVLVLSLAAIGAVTSLETRADGSREAQLRVASLRLALTDLISAPFTADQGAGGPSAPAMARAEIHADEDVLSRGLTSTSPVESSAALVAAAMADMSSVDLTVAEIYRVAARPRGVNNSQTIPALQRTLLRGTGRLFALLKRADRTDAGRAHQARVEAAIGTAVAVLALVGAFLIFYRRSARAGRENERLLEVSRVEASTDALTGLGNRRALTDALAVGMSSIPDEPELLLAMFDLNGFKQYNDTFGHGAGDALLARFGARLATAVEAAGSAYRMGGDEFCLLARCRHSAAEGLLARASSALADHGDGWNIDCSHGATWIPSEATTPSEALRTADQRMYADKSSRSSPSRLIADVLH
jgi:diguanylate cyclase (GGDEF)-like protein